MLENQYCLYCHTSPSGKRYIGVTRQRPEMRWKRGYGYRENEYFNRAIRKYGWKSFKHEIIKDNLSHEEASELEKYYIEKYNTTDRSKGYNIEFGGLNEQKSLSDETKAKISAALRGKYTEAQIEATRHRRNPHYHHSDEIKKIIGDVHRGKPLSDEHKRKLSESHKGIKPSRENLEILKKLRMRIVQQIDMNGIVVAQYDSLKSAEQETGIKYQCISACCRGITSNAGGYLWRYAS